MRVDKVEISAHIHWKAWHRELNLRSVTIGKPDIPIRNMLGMIAKYIKLRKNNVY